MVIGIHLHFSALQAPLLDHVPLPGSHWQVPCSADHSEALCPHQTLFLSEVILSTLSFEV